MAKEPNKYLDFINPIQIIWRAGTPEDPYVDRMDITKVVEQRIPLLEIPDELYRVRIPEMQEINHTRYIKDNLAPNEYYVDYANGFVFFHSSKEAQTITLIYKGRGVILFPSSRIVHFDGKGVSETLFEIIEKTKSQLQELIDRTENFEELLERMIIATNDTVDATDRANEATQNAIDATERVKDAYDTTVLIYQPYVQKESDIPTTYPNPKVGWTVMVYDTGVRYRWNGAEWVPIDAFGGNIPIASELVDGLLSKELYKKLNDIPTGVAYRYAYFIAPDVVFTGELPHVDIAFEGTVVSIRATVMSPGNIGSTRITIEKSNNLVDWTNILSTPLTIGSGSHIDNGTYVIRDADLKVNDALRVNVLDSGEPQKLSVRVDILEK